MWRLIALFVGAVGILVGALLLAGSSPGTTIAVLLKGSLGSPSAIAGTIREMTPLLIADVAVFLGLRAGLFNIGVEGQLLVGAATTAGIALGIPGPAGIVLGLIGGSAAGALWALPAGWIRAYRNGHEVITTIMLNNVAFSFTDWLLTGPLKDPKQESPTTATLAASSRLPNLYDKPPVTLSTALLLALIVTAALGYWLKRRVAGFELQAVGANPTAAEVAGIDPKRTMLSAMLGSGAIAGLAGAVQVLAYEGRFYSGFSPGYGFDALGVALLAGNSSVGLIPSSLLFGVLVKGGTSLQIEGVPKGITIVVLGFLILLAAAIRYRRFNPRA